jgi:uncharacterized delta-60 repeat protein
MAFKTLNEQDSASRRRAVRIALLAMMLICSGPHPSRAADGDLDKSFGKDGIVVSDLNTSPGRDGPFNEGRAIAIQSDGKIVVGVHTLLAASTGGGAIARYNSDGSLDAAFGSGGKVIAVNLGPPDVIGVQADGKIVAAGLVGLMRFTTDGRVDSGFGSAGMVSTGKTIINRLAFLPDGKIIAAGMARPDSGNTFAVLRFNADGSPDSSLGDGGQAIARFPGFASGAFGLALQPDGKMIAAGFDQTGGPYGPSFAALARFNSDGTLDSSFGSSGLVATPQFGVSFGAAAVLDGGKIVAVGGRGPTIFGVPGQAVIEAARYNPDGTVDSTFGNGGMVTSPFSPEPDTTLDTIAISPDGKFLAGGEAEKGLALARYNSDGSPDTSFGAGGTVITHVTDPKEGYPDTIRGIAFQADGQIVVTGDANDDTDVVLARYNAGSDFALSFASPTETMSPGTKTKVTLNIAHRGGYTGNVTITPPDASALDIRIVPNPVTTSGDSVTFKIKVRADTPLGSHPLIFTAQSDGGQAHSITLTLVVQ